MKRTPLIVLLSLIMLICACQQTPIENAVVNKREDPLEASPSPSPSDTSTQLAAIDDWVENFSTVKFNCIIDAEVVLPDIDNYPVYKVRQKEFGADDARQMLEYFAKGATGIRDAGETKEELTEQLILRKRGAYGLEGNPGAWTRDYAGKDEIIAELEQRISAAPEEEYIPFDIENITFPFNKTLQFNDKKLTMNMYSNSITIMTSYNNNVIKESDLYPADNSPAACFTDSIDPELSEETARQILAEVQLNIGLGDYAVFACEKARLLNAISYQPISEGWSFILTRNDGSYQPIDFYKYSTIGLLRYDQQAYARRWHDEWIDLYIDENGVQYFNWLDPIEVVDTVQQSAVLLPFEDIQRHIKQHLKNGFSWMEDDKGIMNISVVEVRLSSCMLPVKDDKESHYIVPVWLVFFDTTESMYNDDIFSMLNVMGVNALDGSFIDLSYRPPG